MLQFGGSEAEKPRVDTFAGADRSYEVDQKSASSRDGSVANGVGLNSNNFRWV